ncbi:HCLS1-binding protein 3 [Arapaima gigas]
MPDGIVTSRLLQNETTGIDLQVPLYQEIRGAMMTGHVEYQIVVVTRLAAFKSAKHRPADVVQLVVRRSLPFFVLVKFISKNPVLATCPELLEFLGAKTTDVADFKSRNVPDWGDEEDDEGLDFFQKDEPPAVKAAAVPKPVKPVVPASPPDEEEEEEEVLDPLGIMRSKKPKQKRVAKPEKPASKPTAPKLTLFDEEVDPDADLFEPATQSSLGKRVAATKDSSLKLFEDPDLGGTVKLGDALLLPTAYREGGAELPAERDEDMDELFRVEEDFEKLLTVSSSATPKPAPAAKPKLAPKPRPALPKKPPSLSQSGTVSSPAAPAPNTKVETMDQMDILRYIQQNESSTRRTPTALVPGWPATRLLPLGTFRRRELRLCWPRPNEGILGAERAAGTEGASCEELTGDTVTAGVSSLRRPLSPFPRRRSHPLAGK